MSRPDEDKGRSGEGTKRKRPRFEGGLSYETGYSRICYMVPKARLELAHPYGH